LEGRILNLPQRVLRLGAARRKLLLVAAGGAMTYVGCQLNADDSITSGNLAPPLGSDADVIVLDAAPVDAEGRDATTIDVVPPPIDASPDAAPDTQPDASDAQADAPSDASRD
jgi:hypothetical protein